MKDTETIKIDGRFLILDSGAERLVINMGEISAYCKNPRDSQIPDGRLDIVMYLSGGKFVCWSSEDGELMDSITKAIDSDKGILP